MITRRCISVVVPLLLSSLSLLTLDRDDSSVSAFVVVVVARPTTIVAAAVAEGDGDGDGDGPRRPRNEFSRVVRAEVIANADRRRRRGGDGGHATSVAANAEELRALARRFDLPRLDALTADLVLRTTTNDDDVVRAEGTLSASLARTCVRTNDVFDVDMTNVDVEAAVRCADVDPSFHDASSSDADHRRDDERRRTQRRRRSKNVRLGRGGGPIDDVGVADLQKLLEEVDYEDDVIEDDAIFKNGDLDVGELVAQMFRLKLDPYPKKPGSKPVKISISG